MSPQVLSIIVGVSGFLGLLSLLAYLFSQHRISDAKNSVSRITEGEDLFTADQVLGILEQFEDDESRLEALKTLTNFDVQKAKNVLGKVKKDVDIEKLSSTSQYAALKYSRILAALFIAIALIGFGYAVVINEEKKNPVVEGEQNGQQKSQRKISKGHIEKPSATEEQDVEKSLASLNKADETETPSDRNTSAVPPPSVFTKGIKPMEPQEQQKNSPVAETPSTHSMNIKDGQLLVIDDDKGVAVVEIIHEKGCKATYRWRYALEPRGMEHTGSGQLFEQYAKSLEKKGMVVNVRGELIINAGPYKVEWSCSSADAGWVYPRGSKAYVMENIAFKDFKL